MLVTLLFCCGVVPALAADATPVDQRVPEYSSIDELNGKRFGTITGTVMDQLVEQTGIKASEFFSFNAGPDQVAALRSHKIDVFPFDEPSATVLAMRNADIAFVPESLLQTEYALFFQKGNPLVGEFNSVIERYWQDGTMEALWQKWVLGPDEDKVLTPQNAQHPKGTITMGTSGDFEPMCYMGSGGEIVGYDVDLATMIANDLGYGLEVVNLKTEAALAAVQAGKIDFGGVATTVTEERAKMVDFTAPTCHVAVRAVVRAKDAQASATDPLSGIAQSFERTFIVEGRWQMIVQGLFVTCCITAAASVLGTALGFSLVFLRKRHGRADLFVDAFQSLMGGLPIVVVLMLLYYVIFGSVDLPGSVVAVVGFALNFAAQASANIWNSVEGVDTGQDEAALALGYTESQSFREVVLPQAARQFVPLLSSQVVSLAKETSIVGYIAVVDLTRASDLIRARTMEAFFPLIVTAIIYFFLCLLLRRWGACLAKRCKPKQGPRVVEGVRI